MTYETSDDRARKAAIAKGKAIAQSGKHDPDRRRGDYLGRIEAWGLDVYEGSRKQWKDALLAELRPADGTDE